VASWSQSQRRLLLRLKPDGFLPAGGNIRELDITNRGYGYIDGELHACEPCSPCLSEDLLRANSDNADPPGSLGTNSTSAPLNLNCGNSFYARFDTDSRGAIKSTGVIYEGLSFSSQVSVALYFRDSQKQMTHTVTALSVKNADRESFYMYGCNRPGQVLMLSRTRRDFSLLLTKALCC